MAKLAAGLSALLVCGSVAAQADKPASPTAPVVEWYLIDLPPVQIASGSLRGKGYTDRMRWRLIAGLNNYRHRLKLANVQRILSDTKSKPNICNPAWLRTPERESYMAFSEPLHIQYANGAVVLKSRLHSYTSFINADGALAVDALLASTKGNLAVQAGRSYDAALDTLAEKAKQTNQLIVLTSARPLDAKLELLQKARADVAYLYPIELELATKHTGQSDMFEFLPVVGNGIFTRNYLGCSNSPLGRQVVADANTIIERERDGFFATAYREWLPASNQKMHAAAHQNAFGHPLRLTPEDKAAQRLDDRIAACLLDAGTWFRGQCEPSSQQKPE
jgi:uncharacterized protein (TIGR02285 family)